KGYRETRRRQINNWFRVDVTTREGKGDTRIQPEKLIGDCDEFAKEYGGSAYPLSDAERFWAQYNRNIQVVSCTGMEAVPMEVKVEEKTEFMSGSFASAAISGSDPELFIGPGMD
ncbi:hypothetical protein XELAEV_18019748mg, partial [Xenopus laevis]